MQGASTYRQEHSRAPRALIPAALGTALFSNALLRALAALLVFAVSVGGLTLTAYADQLANGGVSWGPDAPQIPNAGVNPMGVNLFLEKEVDPAKIERTLQMVKDAGFKWARQGFAWNDIEISGKGDYTDRRNPAHIVNAWDKYDRIVDAYQRYGIEIIARLDSPPDWARIPGDDVQTYHKGPPNNYNDYGDFVYAVASRYKGKIKYFQIWNEPNLLGEWGGHPVNPEEYTNLLKIAHDRIKEANPDAVIITAALAPTAEDSVANLNDILYLEGMYRAGAAHYFDILSTMLYGLGQPPDERRTDLKRLNFSRPILLREVMERNHDANKPVWISEYAWISLPADWEENCQRIKAAAPNDPSQWCGQNIWGRSVDEETQARWEVEGYQRAQSEWPWMGVMCVWDFRDPDADPKQPATYFGIVNSDFTPRPAYYALKAYSQQVTPGFKPKEKPIWNAAGFPLLYGLLGLVAVASGSLGLASMGRWAQAALNRPRGLYSEAAREAARNGAVVAGMALLVGVYYKVESWPLALLCLGAWWLLAFLKPSTGLAMVAFALPFFWYPKVIGPERFPIAETLLVLVFGAVIARGAVGFFLPRLAPRFGIEPRRRGDDGGRPSPSSPPSADGARSTPSLGEPLVSGGSVTESRRPPPVRARIGVAAATAPSGTAVLAPGREAPSLPGQPTAVTQHPTPSTQHPLLLAWLDWNRRDAFAPPAIALLLVGSLSLLTLADPAFARDSFRAYRWVIVEPVLFYFLLTDAVRTRRGLFRVADFFIAGATVVALIGLWQFTQATSLLDVEGVSRVMSVYQHPNNLALYLDRAVPFAVCFAIFLPWGWRKAVYLLVTLPLVATLFLTYSRGAWVAVAIVMLVTIAIGLRWGRRRSAAKNKQRGWLLAGGAALLVVLLGVVALFAIPRLPERISDLGSGVLRIAIWKTAGHMLVDHPILGIGPDQFLNQFRGPYWHYYASYVPDPKQQEAYTSHPHDILLDYWLSLGIMGVIVLIWLLWRYFRQALALIRLAMSRAGDAWPASWEDARQPIGEPGNESGTPLMLEPQERRALVLSLFASMLAFLVHGLVDSSYFLMDLAMIFWMSCGLLQLIRNQGLSASHPSLWPTAPDS